MILYKLLKGNEKFLSKSKKADMIIVMKMSESFLFYSKNDLIFVYIYDTNTMKKNDNLIIKDNNLTVYNTLFLFTYDYFI